MNLAALTAFLSVAERMRAFSDQPQTGWVGFKPRVFGFWHDIAFLQWIRVLDLIRWQPPDIVGGYGQYVSQTNPNTKILRFACPDPLPIFYDEFEFEDWKNEQRERHVEALRGPCGAVFYKAGDRGGTTRTLFENVVYAVAELITNAHYWGRAPAYIGLQRSRVGISVAACDTGHGFVSALSRKRMLFGRGPLVDRHVDALVVGSLINSNLYGLRRAIQSVVDSHGWVTVASYNAEVRWASKIWYTALEMFGDEVASLTDVRTLVRNFRKAVIQLREVDARSGRIRSYSEGLRGARIAFEIPLRRNDQ